MSCQSPVAPQRPTGGTTMTPTSTTYEEESVARCAVLTNDLQYDLVNKNEERRAAVRAFTPKMTAFLEKMRALDAPVVHLQKHGHLQIGRAHV